MTRFLHSGNAGDLIYGLCAVKARGSGELYLGVGEHPQWGELARFPPAYAEALLPLLRAQSYVSRAAVHAGERVDVVLDAFRDHEPRAENLAAAHLRACGFSPELCRDPWLSVGEPLPLGERPVVFARSARYHNPDFDWGRVITEHGEQAVFVGLEAEHAAFVAEYGPVPFRPTADFLELAQLIAGCELFVSNQSAPAAIAEALKVETILEVSPGHRNCLFDRPGQRAYLAYGPREVVHVRQRFEEPAVEAAPRPRPRPRCRARPRPRPVLCATTRQWNPGDELILRGVIHLLAATEPERPLDVCLFDRSPDLQGRSQVLANSWRGQSLRGFEQVLIAGTPEWSGPPLQPLFEAIVRDDVAPTFLGLGSAGALPRLSALDRAVLGRARLITARDRTTHDGLRALGLEPHLLACPALLAAGEEHERTHKQRVGLVLQRDRVTNQSIPASEVDAVVRLCARLQERFEVEVEVVCHYVDEYLWALERFERVRYSYDARDYTELFASYDVVVSTRLHGAIAALSTGAPAVLVNPSPRCRGAAAALPELHTAAPADVPGWLDALDVAQASRAALAAKRRVRAQTLAVLARTETPAAERSAAP